MSDPCQDCRAYVDRLLEEKDRWVEAQLKAIHRDLDVRFAGSDRVWSARLDAVESGRVLALRAVDKAEEQIRDRLAGMNEMRQQLDRQAGTFASQKQVDALQSVIDNWTGRSTMLGIAWSALVVLVSVAVSVAFSSLLRGAPGVPSMGPP
jgi:hypothetical protein